jgi:hypothetical protein
MVTSAGDRLSIEEIDPREDDRTPPRRQPDDQR